MEKTLFSRCILVRTIVVIIALSSFGGCRDKDKDPSQPPAPKVESSVFSAQLQAMDKAKDVSAKSDERNDAMEKIKNELSEE